MIFNRIKGRREEFEDRDNIHAAIKADPVLSALYARRYSEIDNTVAAAVDNTQFKRAMLRLAWIMVRRLTR